MTFSNLLSILCFVGFILAPISAKKYKPADFVDPHNAARAEVGVEPVTWNKTLAAYARDYAHSKITSCEMEHSNGPYGECLAKGYGEMKPEDAVNFWVSEKQYYDHKTNKCVGDECHHYTQVVWKDTKYIGCAKVKCTDKWVFVICNYDPPGNYEGQSPY